MSKYLTLVNGVRRWANALASSAGVSDANKVVMTGADGRVDSSFFPAGIGEDSNTAEASEAISAYAKVTVWDDGGTIKMRNADATSAGKEAVGFVTAAVSSGATGKYYMEGVCAGHTGLVPPNQYFLSTTPGGIVSTPAEAAGNVIQSIGFAISDTEIAFEAGEPIVVE